ncbi:MAG: hypothetical protein M3Y24_11360, partial [Acidobacteriota bacterium]|nr:hypothetical protein [Acidobacteriota bacterium]
MVDPPSSLPSVEVSTDSSQLGDAHAYPRPQLRRKGWLSLNGSWDFTFDENAVGNDPHSIEWSAKIQVPFSPETR